MKRIKYLYYIYEIPSIKLLILNIHIIVTVYIVVLQQDTTDWVIHNELRNTSHIS